MPALAADLRRQLESVVVKAREEAEAAARSALQRRAVDAKEPFDHFGESDRDLRKRLRARGRQAGDVRNHDGTQDIDELTQELAYEYWHRMLFARFLAENHLLMYPDGVAVSLEECDQLAPGEGATNGFVLAARYASRMLPQIFRTDDVLLEIEFAPEQRLALEKLLAGLPRDTFLADDSLGWVYQFWQTKRKDEVNDSGDKIDGHTLPAVTQLFTEHYMVQFLLHNTIGAWWCARHGVRGPAGGAGVPAGQAPVEMEYHRWRDDGTPAAGAFGGWPKTLAEFTLMDPCCGSGHFLVAAFNLLVPLRMHDEGLSAQEACDAVLRCNLFGLELDPRCTQIAAFALALAAWKYPGSGGYRELPRLNIACCGQAAVGALSDWKSLAAGTPDDGFTLGTLFHLFQQAGHLGSLIDTSIFRHHPLFRDNFVDVRSALASLFRPESRDADAGAMTVAAQGIATAADLLSAKYTLIATNVPYLGRGRQADVIKKHIEDHYSEGKADLATAFVLRCLELCNEGGSTALVTPQNWLFLGTYKKLRASLLKERAWHVIARLGPRAFETISGEVVSVTLLVMSGGKPPDGAVISGLDVSEAKTPSEKAALLADSGRTPLQVGHQSDQLRNPDARVAFASANDHHTLDQYAICRLGLGTGDLNHYLRQFWEIPCVTSGWSLFQNTTTKDEGIGGYDGIVAWDSAQNKVRGMSEAERRQAHNQDYRGREVWGKRGIAVSLVAPLRTCAYSGQRFDKGVAVIAPISPEHELPIAAFVTSPEFVREVTAIDRQLKVTNSSLLKVPFDLVYWQAVAAERFPTGLPESRSDDPTQWVFQGDIATSTEPLQVAVARILGYRWPGQPASPDAVDALAATSGIVCLPGVRGEQPASERLLEVLRAAYSGRWSNGVLAKLLADAGCKAGAGLSDWLATLFFDQHCKLFHQRPFIWHVWDGRKDGFSCLVNYHRLNHKTLENLTYSYLGDWITAQTADARAGKTGADLRLAAAQELQEKLKLILAGEPPYDIFVRWKPLAEQPIGWNPDLDDGVRMNIRPFVEAGVLRKNPNVKWTKDRGNEPQRDRESFPWFWDGETPIGDRVNDVHLTNAVKQAARTGRAEAT